MIKKQFLTILEVYPDKNNKKFIYCPYSLLLTPIFSNCCRPSGMKVYQVSVAKQYSRKWCALHRLLSSFLFIAWSIWRLPTARLVNWCVNHLWNFLYMHHRISSFCVSCHLGFVFILFQLNLFLISLLLWQQNKHNWISFIRLKESTEKI